MNTAPYTVTITQADDRTLIVHVGCKTLTFPDNDTLLYELRRYLEDPSTAIHEYAARYGWNEFASPDPNFDRTMGLGGAIARGPGVNPTPDPMAGRMGGPPDPHEPPF
jgi:hypothetical protein